MYINLIFFGIFLIKKKLNICVLFLMREILCMFEILLKEMWNKGYFWLSVKKIERGGGVFLIIRYFKIVYNDLKCRY